MTPAHDLIDRLLAVFGEPRTENVPLFLEEFANAVKGWDGAVLVRAGDEVIRDCVYWPKPAEIIERAERIAARMNPTKMPPPTVWGPEPTAEQKARVQAMVDELKRKLSSPVGYQPRGGTLSAASRRMTGDSE